MYQQPNGNLRFSPTDLVNHLRCQHLTGLNLARARKEPGFDLPPYENPFAERVADYGDRHEQAHLERLEAQGLNVTKIDTNEIHRDNTKRQQAMDNTEQAMSDGADIIYQAVLGDEKWGGQADFLYRVNTPSGLGEWSYEVADTKLARTAKPAAFVQMAEYSQHLTKIQELQPQSIHVVLGDNTEESFPLRHVAPYHQAIKAKFLTDTTTDLLAVYPDKVEHCQRCAWNSRCRQRRIDDDHLTLVADLGRTQAQQLLEHNVAHTLTELATTTAPIKPPRMAQATFEKLINQAKIQHNGRQQNKLIYELLEPTEPDPKQETPPLSGLETLPEPSDGDLFFDIESDTLLGDGGLEYLFGWVDTNANYTAQWALNTVEEKQQVETFIDMLTERLTTNPGFHVYHYAPYEEAAIKRLVTRHGTREAELDHLLRSEVFVDLYRIVRQSLRASVESYSLKKIERFYGFARTKDNDSVDSGTESAVALEAWIQQGSDPNNREQLDAIETYNLEDCEATRQLRDWLETLRNEAQATFNRQLQRPATPQVDQSGDAQEFLDELQQLQTKLTQTVPEDPQDRTADQQARWLLAQLLMFHRRESNVEWWDYFRRKELAENHLTGTDTTGAMEDSEIIAGLTFQPELTTVGKRNMTHYTFTFPPDQECKLDQDDTLHDPITGKSIGTLDSLNTDTGHLTIRRSNRSSAIAPEDLTVAFLAATSLGRAQRDALIELAHHTATVTSSLAETDSVAHKLLTRTPPTLPTRNTDETLTDYSLQAATHLGSEYLAIQGPPGTGKSTTGSALIVKLIEQGHTVGITANSHAVINNLLTKVLTDDTNNQVRAIKSLGSSTIKLPGVHSQSGGYDKIREFLDTGDPKGKVHGGGRANLLAGTPSAMSNTNIAGALDYLVIDEAGQMAMAEAIAATQATKNLILLGDPNQLGQPTRAAHPDGTNDSALDHIIGANDTIPADQGILLDTTYRMHPNICTYISHHFYDDKLHAHHQTNQRTISDLEPGIHAQLISHQGRRAWCPEEAQAIVTLINDLLTRDFTDIDIPTRPIGETDILVVAPYNAAVQEIRQHLQAADLTRVPVGTVDKFQGQQAPIVIYSMTASTAELAPRGIGFLTDPSRLNVAISRAQHSAYVVAAAAIQTSPIKQVSLLRGISAACAATERLSNHCEAIR